MSSGSGETTGSSAAETLARAHAALLKQTDLQFSFAAPQKPPETPGWLKAFSQWLGHIIEAIAPVLKVLFWAGLALAAVAILYFLLREVAGVRLGRRKPAAKPAPMDLDGEWRPAPARARTLLEDADRLAAEGRFAEAAHLLLFRSIEDIDGRWPHLVRPALTSRDIADHPTLPEAARQTFAAIARTVETGFFGGRTIGADDFDQCRRAYAAFALPARP